MPCYLPVMQFAHSSDVRQKLYRAYVTRASDQAEGDAVKFDNAAIMGELLSLRMRKRSCSATATCRRFAGAQDGRLAGTGDRLPARPGGQGPPLCRQGSGRHARVCRQRARPDRSQRPGTGPTSAKSSRKRATPSANRKSSPISPHPRCWRACSRSSKPCSKWPSARQGAPVWHPGVEFYRIERSTAPEGTQLVGQFYLDPAARTGKRGGAWMDDVRARWLRPDTGATADARGAPGMQLRRRRRGGWRRSRHC
jgi:oligopeptidase A